MDPYLGASRGVGLRMSPGHFVFYLLALKFLVLSVIVHGTISDPIVGLSTANASGENNDSKPQMTEKEERAKERARKKRAGGAQKSH